MRAQGPGGQHGDKASTAVHLRFDVARSSLPEAVKARLLALPDQRLTRDGVLVIKAQGERSQERNRADALARLQALVDQAAEPDKPRRPTRPSRASQRRRVEAKKLRGEVKVLRQRASDG
jgi:ribosome-associated protein